MTKKNYTAVANILRKVDDTKVTRKFADMFEKEFKNFNRDFFIEYIEKGKISKETRAKHKQALNIEIVLEDKEVSFDTLFKELDNLGMEIGFSFTADKKEKYDNNTK